MQLADALAREQALLEMLDRAHARIAAANAPPPKKGAGRTPADPRAQAAFAKLRGEPEAPIATLHLVRV